jgi:hypothetical protein
MTGRGKEEVEVGDMIRIHHIQFDTKICSVGIMKLLTTTANASGLT